MSSDSKKKYVYWVEVLGKHKILKGYFHMYLDYKKTKNRLMCSYIYCMAKNMVTSICLRQEKEIEIS